MAAQAKAAPHPRLSTAFRKLDPVLREPRAKFVQRDRHETSASESAVFGHLSGDEGWYFQRRRFLRRGELRLGHDQPGEPIFENVDTEWRHAVTGLAQDLRGQSAQHPELVP